jgi:hypothetical protein
MSPLREIKMSPSTRMLWLTINQSIHDIYHYVQERTKSLRNHQATNTKRD